MQKTFRINNQIRALEVNVIDNEGGQLGVMKIYDALSLARGKDLDLVEVGPNVQPPIAKIMDYGKYMYQKERQEKKARVKQKDQETKTVRVGFKTGEHDMQVRSRQIDEFLQEGHVVRIELTLRGREKALSDVGKERFDKFLKMITGTYVINEPVRRSPFGWLTVIRRDKK